MVIITLFIFMPMLSVNAAIEMENTYQINKNDSNISYIDLSSYFNDYQGCFVLFDATTDSWQIYNKVMAQKRISPDSTYKIYSALLGLENRYITSASSEMTWNGQEYPIAEWNANQNLTTAFQNSVNWYFQSLDQAAGLKTLLIMAIMTCQVVFLPFGQNLPSKFLLLSRSKCSNDCTSMTLILMQIIFRL